MENRKTPGGQPKKGRRGIIRYMRTHRPPWWLYWTPAIMWVLTAAIAAADTGGLFRVLTLKLIGLLWLAVLLSNLFAEKFAAELMRWYPFYSVVVGLITTGILCHLAT